MRCWIPLLGLLCLTARADPGRLRTWREPLASRDGRVRQRAAARLAGLGSAGHYWITRFSGDDDPRVRAAVAGVLRRLPVKTGLPILTRLLADPDAGVRSESMRALLLDGTPQLSLVKRHTRPNDPALRHWTGVLAYKELLAALPDGHWIAGVYPGMFERLRPLGALAVEPLLRIARHPKQGRREMLPVLACEALGALKATAAIEPLKDMYEQVGRRQRSLQEAIAVALYKLGETEEADQLIQRYRRWANWGRRKGYAYYQLGQLLQRIGQTQDAIDAFEFAHQEGAERRHAMLHYNLACLQAPRRPTRALHHLEQALKHGFGERDWIARDRRLDPIRRTARFRELLPQR